MVVKNTSRDGNMCADHLANLGLSLEFGSHIWEDPPPSCSLMLFTDRVGTYVPRGF